MDQSNPRLVSPGLHPEAPGVSARALPGLWPWLMLGFGILVYGRALGTYFAQDDFRWLWEAARAPRVGPFTPRYLSFTLYFRTLSSAFGFTPWLFHAFNLGLHLATGWLFYRLLAARLPAAWAAVAAAAFLSSPAIFDALHWVSAVGDLLCGFFLALTLWLLVGTPAPRAWRPWVALASYALALSSKEIAVGAAPLLGLLAWQRDRKALPAVGFLVLGAVGAMIAIRLGPNTYSVTPAAALVNLPGYLSAAVAAGLAAHATSDLRWARTTLALAAGWSALLAWIVWVARRPSPAATFGLAWFLALLAPLLLLERQFYFFYLYCALPGLLASLALRLHSTGRIASKVAPVLVALVLAQAVAVEVRARSRLKYAPLPSDFVLRRALAARNALADLEAHAAALKPRLVLVGQQPLETSAGGMTTTRETAYTLDPFWDDNVRAALGEGDAIRLRYPSVEQVEFYRWVDPADSASAIAPYQIDGHLQVMDYATYAGGQSLGPGAGLEERMARAAYLIERRLFPEARAELEAAYRLAPDHPDVLLNLGTVNFRLGDTTAAIRALARAIEVAPQDAEALFDLGLAYWRTGRTDAARELWGRLEDGAPRSDLARRARDMMSGRAR